MAVNEKFKMHRAGLSLILQGLPTNLGAYHVIGSNMIIINKRILDIIKKRKSVEEYNSYLFMILAHEYLHSFGIVDELEVRNITYDLCQYLFGEEHLATIMARYQPWAAQLSSDDYLVVKVDAQQQQSSKIKSSRKRS
jgi:hypothetical protein